MSRVHVGCLCLHALHVLLQIRLSGFSPPSFSGGPVPSHWLVVKKNTTNGENLETLGRLSETTGKNMETKI